jgi:predicted acyltransferase (DUF342 family)
MVKNLPTVERSTKVRFGKHVPDSIEQEENTIVFNASNVLVSTPYSNAVYLSPIRNKTDYTAPEIVLLMYDRNTKEITESGESANALIGGSTLDTVVNRNNATSNTVQFIGGGMLGNGTGFVTDSNIGISNLLPQHTVSVGSNLYIDDVGSNVLVVSGNVAILDSLVVDGNLRVNGGTTVIYTENTAIRDPLIELGTNNGSSDTTLDLGILMHRPEALSNVVIGYREGTDEFALAYTDAKPTDKTFTPKTDEDINVHVYGLTHVDANIYAHEDVLVDGNVYVSTNVSITEELTVSNNVYADKDLEVVGNVYVDGNVVAYKDFTLSGNAYVTGNVSITEELTVSNNVYADKDLEVVGNVYVDGNVVAYKDFTLTGNAYVTGNVIASKDFTLTGNAYVSGNVSITEELTVSNNVYADKDLEVMGNVYVDGNVVASKDFTLTGNAYVTGNVVASKDFTLTGNAYVTGNVVASKDFTLTGNAYVSGNVSITEELTVSNNVYADKDLEVMGNVYVDGNVVASKDFTLTGNAYVSGNVSITEKLIVSNNMYADKDLEVTGNVYIDSNVVAYKDFILSGNAYVTGNIEVTEVLIVSGNTHLEGDNVFITHTMDFLDPTTAIVTDQVSNVQIRLGQLENVANTVSNPLINQVLTYNQDNSEWSNAYPDQTIVQVKNTSGVPITRGQAVHVTGSNGNNMFQVELADASDPTKMPAIGIVYEDIPINGEGAVVTFGRANGISGISGYTNGDTLYVASGTPGDLTNVKPYGVDLDLIQNVGVVVNHSSGVMFVTGIGRANDIPNARIITDYNDMQYVYVNSENNDLKKIASENLNIPLTTAVSSSSNSVANAVTLRGVSITSGDGFHGDLVVTGNVTVDSTTLHVDAETSRVGVGTIYPGQPLDVRGAANVGALVTTSTVISDATVATDQNTGALQVTGGVGVGGNLYATNGVFSSNITVGNLVDGANKYLPMVNTNGTFVKSPVYVSPTGRYVITAEEAEFLGNITLSGNTTILSSTSVVIEDRIFGIASNNSADGLDSGILIEHQDAGQFSNIGLIHHADEHTFSIGYTQNTFTDEHILYAPHSDGTILTVDLLGNVNVQNSISVSELGTFGTRVGIGVISPDSNLYVTGNAHVTSNISTDSNVIIGATTEATSTTTGALKVTGGVGVQGALYGAEAFFGGAVTGASYSGGAISGTTGTYTDVLTVSDNTPATTTTTGALQVAGGVGVVGEIHSGAISAAKDQDVTSYFGRAAIGYNGSSADAATFAHVDHNTGGSYALKHNLNGRTDINSASGQDILFNINNAEKAKLTSDGDFVVDTDTLYVDAANDRVGINKAAPAFTLDVDGDINFTGTFRENGTPFVSTPWTIETSPDALSYTDGFVGIGEATPDATLHITGNAYVTTNLHASNVYTTGGLITNTGGTAKKTYSHTGTLPANATVANATFGVVFSNHVFYAKITATLVEGTDTVSSFTQECCGGHITGGTSLNNITLGQTTVIGHIACPWSTEVTANVTTVTFKAAQAVEGAGYYDIFVEYLSAHTGGRVLKFTEGGLDEITFNY